MTPQQMKELAEKQYPQRLQINGAYWHDTARREAFIHGLQTGLNMDRWISVKDKPLVVQTEFGWECTEDGEGEFMAAIMQNTGWWIHHCHIVDRIGLCVINEDDDDTPAGYEIEDVQFWQPIIPPTK